MMTYLSWIQRAQRPLIPPEWSQEQIAISHPSPYRLLRKLGIERCRVICRNMGLSAEGNLDELIKRIREEVSRLQCRSLDCTRV